MTIILPWVWSIEVLWNLIIVLVLFSEIVAKTKTHLHSALFWPYLLNERPEFHKHCTKMTPYNLENIVFIV